jgi:hypothetical protein
MAETSCREELSTHRPRREEASWSSHPSEEAPSTSACKVDASTPLPRSEEASSTSARMEMVPSTSSRREEASTPLPRREDAPSSLARREKVPMPSICREDEPSVACSIRRGRPHRLGRSHRRRGRRRRRPSSNKLGFLWWPECKRECSVHVAVKGKVVFYMSSNDVIIFKKKFKNQLN